MNRVVITGVGAVTPIGTGREELWQNVKAGVCGIDRITRFDPSEFACQIAAEVKDFDPTKYIFSHKQIDSPYPACADCAAKGHAALPAYARQDFA